MTDLRQAVPKQSHLVSLRLSFRTIFVISSSQGPSSLETFKCLDFVANRNTSTSWPPVSLHVKSNSLLQRLMWEVRFLGLLAVISVVARLSYFNFLVLSERSKNNKQALGAGAISTSLGPFCIHLSSVDRTTLAKHFLEGVIILSA